MQNTTHKLKHSDIDVNNSSTEELLAEIERLGQKKTDHRNADLSAKIIINSIYGVLGYLKFICYNRDVAESVTLQSQDIIKYTETIMNDYFKNIFYTEEDTLKELGVTRIIAKFQGDVVKYMDTDSVFLDMNSVYKSVETSLSEQDFILALYDGRLKSFIKQKLNEYTDGYNASRVRFNGKDSFNLEMEQIAESIMWVAKKRYAKSLTWYKNVTYDSLGKVEIIGLETRKSSSPKYVREKIEELIMYLLEKKGKPSKKDLFDRVSRIRKEFDLLPIEDICETKRISKYNQYVPVDTDKLSFAPRAPEHTRGAGYYNHMLYKSDFKDRYDFIKTGNRVKFYQIKDPTGKSVSTFSFLAGSFPAEFAPDMNKDLQFEKIFLNPVNNIIAALGMSDIEQDMQYIPSFEW